MNLLDPLQEVELSFYYGEEKISFLRQDQSQSERITIEIDRNHQVIARAPRNASDATVIHAVKKRARWISEQLKDLKQQDAHIIPRRYISGESHFYLGRRYQLKVFPLETDDNQHTEPSLLLKKQAVNRESDQNSMRDLFEATHEPVTDLFDPTHIAMVDHLKTIKAAMQTIHPQQNHPSQNSSAQEYVRHHHDLLEIYTLNKAQSHIAALLNDWYRTQAEAYFQARLLALAPKILSHHHCPRLALSWMTQQWSEYHAGRNTLVFNIHLIKADQEIIDYVILCELLQLPMRNTDRDHYSQLLAQHCPKWRTISTRLERMAGYYLQ